MSLTYVKGDITRPIGPRPLLIAHLCNDQGRWGAGVSGAIGSAFPAAEKHYREAHAWPLGTTQFCYINDDITVANMVGQHRVGNDGVRPPIRYLALALAMQQVADYIECSPGLTIHAPRFGAGLAGGKWETIEHLILELWTDRGIDVTIYDLA